jgi:hypothetical protein
MPTAITTFNEAAHVSLARELDTSRQDRAFLYWRIGRQLNLEYGASGRISGGDWEKLEDIYGISTGTFRKARQFAATADTVTDARAVISDYRSWYSITADFLVGREPGASARDARELRAATRPAEAQAEAPGDEEESPISAHVRQRSFNVHPEVTERVSARFGWTTDYTAKVLRELMDRDRQYFVNTFITRLQRAGFHTV